MNRFTLSDPAERDLDEIIEYLRGLPMAPARRAGLSLQAALRQIARHPFEGRAQSALTLIAGHEVRSWLCAPYRIFYSLQGTIPEILGIIHTSRDLPAIMEKRLH